MTRLEYDRTHIWHPYASLRNPPPVREVASASGATWVRWSSEPAATKQSSLPASSTSITSASSLMPRS